MSSLIRTARATGAWYLGLAVTGMLGFLVLRGQIFTGDSAQTLAHLTDNAALAHLTVVMELLIVITQAVAAVWFYKMLRGINPMAGVSIAAFGLINAVAILASAASMGAAIAVAGDASLAPGGDAAATVGLLEELSAQSWGVGAIFFGLWLIPMGWVALQQRRFPTPLGYALLIGGVGYVASALVGYGVADAPGALIEGLTMPASVGEFWMIGYLLIKGIRTDAHPKVRAAQAADAGVAVAA